MRCAQAGSADTASRAWVASFVSAVLSPRLGWQHDMRCRSWTLRCTRAPPRPRCFTNPRKTCSFRLLHGRSDLCSRSVGSVSARASLSSESKQPSTARARRLRSAWQGLAFLLRLVCNVVYLEEKKDLALAQRHSPQSTLATTHSGAVRRRPTARTVRVHAAARRPTLFSAPTRRHLQSTASSTTTSSGT